MPTSHAKSVPPGPANLLAQTLQQDSIPNDGNTTDTGGESSAVASRGVTPESDVDSALPHEPATATTTIVTKTQAAGHGQVKTTSETLQHVNAESVTALFGKDGSVSLKPVGARGAGKIKTRRTHTFQPRTSAFDRDNPASQQDPFRGFWTLFWIMIFVGAVRTGVYNYQDAGEVWGTRFAKLISEDAKMLAVSDAVMVSVTILCVPFAKLVNSGWIRYYWTGAVLQHSLQTLFLAAAVRWTFYRGWPWVQSGFMVLHTLSMLMKVHSYCSHNGELSDKSRRLKVSEYKLNELVTDHGGMEKLCGTALTTWNAAKELPSPDPSASPSSLSAAGMRRRTSSNGQTGQVGLKRSSSRSRAEDDTVPVGLELLAWHPEELIAALAAECFSLREALTSHGVAKVHFPSNLTYANYFDYLLVPTLVYELEYPRTNKIRPVYILEKTLATFGTLSLLILIVEHYILDVSPGTHDRGFFVAVLDLAIPFIVCYLLIFYIIFECICNVFAEITRFSDREFYQDWWNSTSFDEFSRRWNVPVHAFLLRHVYSSTISTYHFSKFQAAFTTFLLSACVHELVMAVVTQKVRPYLFAMQMAQLPLIMFGRLPIFRKHPALGNLFFWIGLLSGFPLLAVAYIRY